MKIYILPIINFLSNVYVHVDAQGEIGEALAIVKDVNGHGKDLFKLPFLDVPTLADTTLIRACPAETPLDQKYMKLLTKKFYKFGYCLFDKKFGPDQTKVCKEEVKPMLNVLIDEQTKQPIKCGPKNKHHLYEFGFYKIKDFRFNTTFFPIYDVCIHSKKGFALWTKHNIMTPAIYLNPYNEEKLKYEMEDPPISTDALIFKKRRYESLKKKYENDGKQKIKMNANLMVPREHIALRIWRKTTNHFMVAAPLWDGLQNLTNELNDALKRLALFINPNQQLLTIYTKFQKSSSWYSSATTWYRLLYEEQSKLATLVVIQNTPNVPPDAKTIKTLCDTQTSCDMASWFIKLGQEPRSPENLNYAICCDTSSEEVLRLFRRHLHIAGHWNIDDVFKNMHQQQQSQLKNKKNKTNYPPNNAQPYSDYPQRSPMSIPSAPRLSELMIHHDQPQQVHVTG